VDIEDQIAQIAVLNNTLASKVEEMLPMRWEIQSLVWIHNKTYEFVLITPGQKPTMPERIGARIEAEQVPKDLNIMVTVADGTWCYPVSVQVKPDANLDQLMQA
jgi:hypothetical protein